MKDELAARAQYVQLSSVVPRAQFRQRAAVSQFCQSISTRFPGTPSAEKAKTIADAISPAVSTDQPR